MVLSARETGFTVMYLVSDANFEMVVRVFVGTQVCSPFLDHFICIFTV